MKRLPDESFEDYKKRRKLANEETKARLKGRRVFESTYLSLEKDPETGDEKVVIKTKTYQRGKNGLSMSQADKNRYDALLRKAERKAKNADENTKH